MWWFHLNSICHGQILYSSMSLQGSYEVKTVRTIKVLAYLLRELRLLQLNHLLCPRWWDLASLDLRMSPKNAASWMKKGKLTPNILSEGVSAKNQIYREKQFIVFKIKLTSRSNWWSHHWMKKRQADIKHIKWESLLWKIESIRRNDFASEKLSLLCDQINVITTRKIQVYLN